MKNFKRLVGLLLCLAMVLSIVPASIVGAAELGATTEIVMQKIDLTDCIVAACSNNFNSSLSYSAQDWFTNDFTDFNSEWKDFGDLVDGYYYNNVYFGCTSPERADLYIDLTEKYGGAVALDQLKIYHGGFGAVPSVYVVLVLEGGTKIEKTFTLGWEGGVEADPLTWTFDETYNIEGVYIWQNNNTVKAYYGEIELLAEKEVECEVVEIIDLDTPTFGYYADGDTDGTLTPYYQDGYGPENLIDGDPDSYVCSESYTYSEIQNGEKIPAILFDLGQEFSLAGVEVNGYQYGYYNMCDFTIQVYDSTGTWKTVKTVTKAFDTSIGAAGEDTEPVMYRFDAVVGSKVRILVDAVNDMGDEDPDQKVTIDGFRVREISLYNGYGEAPEEETDTNAPSILDDLVLMESAPTPDIGYYIDTNDTIVEYLRNDKGPASNLVDGDTETFASTLYFTHAEVTAGEKIPAILFDFETTTVLGGLDIYGYEVSRYNMEDFEVQVYTANGWETAASVTDAFYEEGVFGEDLSGPLTVEFDQLYTGTQVRILVSGMSDMTPDAGEDAEMAEGSYIRVREIQFYSEEAPGPYIETANINGVDLSEYVIVYSADEPDYNLRAAKHIRTVIKQKTGRVLTIVEDDTEETDCEILVGNTNRDLSQTVTAPANNAMKFTIQTSGTKIALEADYFIIAGAAYYFTETYINNASFDVTVSDVTRAPITEKANNYIMLIGDGMGVNQTKMFEAYDVPTSGDFAYSDGEDIFYGYYLPYYGLVKTSNSSGTTTDSAAAGTALATGYKTVNTWIGVDASGNSVQSLTELALSLGMGAAVMSTEEVTGATPAAFSSHVSARSDSSGILADQAALRAEGAIIYDEDYYPYYTAEEWAVAEASYIKTLNQVAQNDSFFLMYEEAYIDKNGHYSNAPWCFRTMYRFNQAIGFFMEFAMYNPDTLVVITADHETGNMDSTFTFDGGGSHSNQDVPIFAYGVGASAFDTDSSYHNTSIARTFASMMTDGNADDFGDSQWPILTAGDETVEPEEPEATEPTDPTEAPTLPEGGVLPQGQVYKIINNQIYVTGDKAGYIDANGDFIVADDCLADGGYGKPGYLNEKVPDVTAVIAQLELSQSFNIGAIEVSCDRNTQNDPTDFEIQAYVDGEWVTVKTVTGAFTGTPRTARYTFEPVETTQIRLYITSYEGSYCSVGEIELYEVTTGNLVEEIDLTDRTVTADCDVTADATLSTAVVGTVTDGDKSTIVIFQSSTPTITIDLTNGDGTPTNVSAFSLFGNRSSIRPTSVEILLQTTAGGSYVSVGTYTFSANTGTEYPFAPYYTELGASYDAYGLQIAVKGVNEGSQCALAEIELYGVTALPLDAPTGLTATATKNTITATADTTTGGKLMFKLDDGVWQESGEFAGLEEGTTYTLYAKYVAEDGYIDSAETSVTVTTAKNIEIGGQITTEPIEDPVTPIVGYYSDNNTDGAITEHWIQKDGKGETPSVLVDGITGSSADYNWTGYYTHEEIASGAKIPVYFFEFDEPRAFTGVTIDTYKAMYYCIEDFTVQVYIEGEGWVTATTVADSFSSQLQEEYAPPETHIFAEPLYGTKIRILVNKLWDMYDWRYDDDNSFELATGAYARLREITLLEDPDYVPPTNTQNVLKAPAYLNTTYISDTEITVVAPPSTEYPEAQIKYVAYKVSDGTLVATNYTGVFTDLEHNTAYTIYAQYIGDGEVWLDSHIAVNETATDKDKLPAPTNVDATLGTTTITATADPVDGGTLMFRLLDANHIAISGMGWSTNNTFTGLTAGTQYYIQVKYNGDINHYDSEITELAVTTGKTLLAKPTLTVSGTTHNTITLNALPTVTGGAAEYSYSVDGIEWIVADGTVITGLNANTTYYLRACYVATDNAYNSSLYSEVVTATTKMDALPAPVLTVVGTTDSSITVTAEPNANGILKFSINGTNWQESGTFTGLNRNTEYTIQAKYFATGDYTDSAIVSTTATTEKTKLPTPTGLTVTGTTDSSITVTADSNANGTLVYRINGGDWQVSNVFTGLDRNTEYTIEAMYTAADGFINSDVASTTGTTAKTQLTAPTGLTATNITANSITVTADPVVGGTLMFRLAGGAWQASGTFTGLTHGTNYTIEAMYVADDGYIDSPVRTTSEKTLTILSAPVLSATSTDTTITASAPAVVGGTVQYRINGGAWQASGTFTGLDWNTTYTISAMYVAGEGYVDSGISTISVATTRPADPAAGQYADLEAIPESGITPHVGYNNYPNHEMYAENTVTGGNIGDAMFGTLTQVRGDDVTFTNADFEGYKRLSVVYDLNGGATKIGAVELTGGDYNLTKFAIQVKNTSGVWQTVKFVTNDLFDISDKLRNDTVLITFTPVTGTKVRLMIYGYEENPNNAPEIREMVVYEAKDDAQLELKSVSSGTTEVFDGNKAKGFTGTTATMYFDNATSVKRLKLFGDTAETSIGAYTVMVQTTKGGAWTEVATGTAFAGAGDNTCIVNLDQEYQVFGIQVIADKSVTIPEIEVYGYKEAFVPADPDLPAETPTDAPERPTAVSPVQTTPAETQPVTVPTGDSGMADPEQAQPNVPAEGMTNPVQGDPEVPNSGNDPEQAGPNISDEGADPEQAGPEIPDSGNDPEQAGPSVSDETNLPTPTQATVPVTIGKFDLSDSTVYLGSEDADSSADFAERTWLKSNTTILTDEDTTNEEHVRMWPGYRADCYVDIGTVVSATQLQIYYTGYENDSDSRMDSDVPSLTITVYLSDGSTETKEFADLGWQGVESGSVTWDFDETYQIEGIYVWSPDTPDDAYTHFSLSEVELYGYVDGSSSVGTTTVGSAGYEKHDLLDTVVGCDSQNAASQSDYSKLTWYTDTHTSWRTLNNFVDGDYTNDVHWGLDPHERADVYLDLTGGANGYTAVDQIKLYHSRYSAVPTVYVALLLADGNMVENTFTLGWQQGVSSDPFVYTYDQTYNVVGLYVWQNQNSTASFSDIELYQKQTVQLDAPANLQATATTEDSITVAANILSPADAGKLQFRINSGAWQDADANGYYTFTGLTAGTEYTVEAQYLATGSGYITTATPTSESFKTDAPKIYTVSGTTNAGATVTLYKDGAVKTTATADSDGKYSFANVAMENYTLVITKYGYSSYTEVITVDTDVTKNVTLTQLTYTVSGTTTAGATVQLYKDGVVKYTATATDGSYSIANVPMGSYSLVITKYGYTPYTEVISVNANVTKNITLTQLTYTVSGTTTAGATVQLYKDGAVKATTTADGSGNYSFSGVAMGSYTLVFTKYGYEAQTAVIAVNANVTKNAALTQLTYTVSGTTTAGATVQLYKDGVVKFTATADGGSYSFSGVPMGSYSLVITKYGYTPYTEVIAVSGNVTKNATLTQLTYTVSGTTTAGATVQLYKDGAVVATDVADDGSYSFSNVELGNYTLVFTKYGYTARIEVVTVNQNVARTVELTQITHTISGTVTGTTNDAAAVKLYKNGVLVNSTTAAANGTYTFSGVAMGNYSILVEMGKHIAQSATVTVSDTDVIQNFTLSAIPMNSTEVAVDAIVAPVYNVRLYEPWALRVKVTFCTTPGDLNSAINLSNFTSYGAYAIIAHQYGDGTTAPTTWEDIVNDPNAVQFKQAAGEGDGNIWAINDTTAAFDFYEGLYTYRLAENVYWVAYYEDAEGIHFTEVRSPKLMDKVDNIIEKISGDADQDTQRIVLEHMKQLYGALLNFRDEANLGQEYAAGKYLGNVDMGAVNTGTYQFGKSHKIRLIEPWSVKVTYQVRNKSTFTVLDFANATDYGVIFYHDKTGEYYGNMTAAQMLERKDAVIYSKSQGNITLEDGKMVAVYDKGIFTYELDSAIYCLPFVVVDGQYHYGTNANRIDLIDQMYAYYNNTTLSNKERATFQAMIQLHESTMVHRKKYGK